MRLDKEIGREREIRQEEEEEERKRRNGVGESHDLFYVFFSFDVMVKVVSGWPR